MKIKVLLRFCLLGLILVGSGGIIHAQQIPKIALQGFLKDATGKALADGTQAITFKLYNTATGGTAEWTDTQTINVFGGVYSTHLGSATKPLDALNWGAATYFVGITVQGTELSPRNELTFAPYSLGSPKAQEVVCSGAVGDVKYSYLDPTQFAAVNGECWVPMDGRSITGSKLASITGLATITNVGGMFLRGQEMNGSNNDPDRTESSPILSIQTPAVGSHKHTMTGITLNYNDTYTSYIERGPYDSGVSDDITLPENGTSSYIKLNLHTGSSRGAMKISNSLATKTLSLTGLSVSSGGQTETRPTNINLYTYVRIN
jgi:hypothetical protein